MPSLTGKDREALIIAAGMGVRHFALSFASRGTDIAEIRSIVGEYAFVISKIECRNGVTFLDDIAAESDALLIDRGDLSRQYPIQQIPRLQKQIIRRVKSRGRKIYVATNLLESMVTDPMPTRAEVNDIYNTFVGGGNGDRGLPGAVRGHGHPHDTRVREPRAGR
jgi:pyruvate kinase